MSTRSRERRKAKQARQRAQSRERSQWVRGDSQGGGGQQSVFTGQRPLREVAESLVHSALRAHYSQDTCEVLRCVHLLAEGLESSGGHRVVDTVIVGTLHRFVHQTWHRGWQPADVERVVERRLGARHAGLAIDGMAAQMRGYARATVDERWEAQLAAMSAEVWWERDDHYIRLWGDREGLGRPLVIEHALELMSVLQSLPELPRLCPLPGTARRSAPGASRPGEQPPDQRLLDRVRALLAKAESTEFAEEAEAFTAKAQELMARHSIDHALLAAGAGTRDEPVGRRVSVDRPYEPAKALLLQKVAEANRCRTTWSKEFGFTTVLGFASDLDAVELLYTSLLVQATTAVVHAGPRRDRYGQSRTRSFRQSFLTAYAIRIGQRLTEATEQASSDAIAEAGNDRLLPVLAARDDAVRRAADAMFRETVGRDVRISDREGWVSGTAAADLASLDVRDALAGERAS